MRCPLGRQSGGIRLYIGGLLRQSDVPCGNL
jgi:hypothetical protein